MSRTESNDIFFLFSLHASAGLVRTMGLALHITRKTAMCAYVPRDTQENIVKLVGND